MTITLLTDFGTRDVYLGVVKGVIAQIAPAAHVIDLTHDIPAQDIAAAAFALAQAYRYFPNGTVHVAVVDPGVGSDRKAIAAEIDGHLFVCPDNGILSWVLAKAPLTRAVMLTDPRYHLGVVSRTFHARDIFGPVAAHLANGLDLDELGPRCREVTTFEISRPELRAGRLACHAVAVDGFGNVITDLPEDLSMAGARLTVVAGGRTISGTGQSYSNVASGEPVAVFGSSGYLEIAVRNGSAARDLGLSRGDEVIVALADQRSGPTTVAGQNGRLFMATDCPTCGCTIPPFTNECPRCKRLREEGVPITARVDKGLLAGRTPEAPAGTTHDQARLAAERDRQFQDAQQARKTYLAFQGAGLPIIRSSELPTGINLARGESCYLCVRAGHWMENPDGSRKAGDYGQLLITAKRLIFKSFKGTIHEHEIGRIAQLSYDLESVSVKRDEARPRDFYKLEQPADAMVKLLCVYKMENLTPPMDNEKFKALMEPASGE